MSSSSLVIGTLKAEVVGPGSSLPVSLSDNYGQMMVGFIPREEGTSKISSSFVFILDSFPASQVWCKVFHFFINNKIVLITKFPFVGV